MCKSKNNNLPLYGKLASLYYDTKEQYATQAEVDFYARFIQQVHYKHYKNYARTCMTKQFYCSIYLCRVTQQIVHYQAMSPSSTLNMQSSARQDIFFIHSKKELMLCVHMN